MWQLRTSKGQSIPLRALPGVLGSSPDADVSLPHNSVRPTHARLCLDDSGALLIVAADDQAVLGVNGKRVRRARLAGGETLIVGRLKLQVVAPASTPADTPADEQIPDFQLRRKPAPAPGSVRAAGTRAAKGGRPKPPKRHRGQALVVPKQERSGLLGTDLAQLSMGTRLAILAILLLIAAGVAWALGLGLDAVS